jgi:hypothetical protein
MTAEEPLGKERNIGRSRGDLIKTRHEEDQT